jgi:hypothetical protein
MTLVHNWHLGRRMEYPYFESRPKRHLRLYLTSTGVLPVKRVPWPAKVLDL